MGRPGEHRHGFDEHPGSLRETRRALAETGVRLLDVEVVQIKEGIDPRAYLPALEATAELGGRFVLTNVYTPDRSAAQDGLARALRPGEAARPDHRAGVRQLFGSPDARQTIEMVGACGRENAAVLIDTLHLHSSREPLSAAWPTCRPIVSTTSTCVTGRASFRRPPDDLRRIAREERLFPGEGGIDVAGVLQRLPAGIVYAVEVQNPARASALGAEAYARLAFEATRRYLAERCGGRGAT